jgi:hypothetical protein
MQTYYCFITALMPSYQDDIISGLLGKGYMVGPAAKDSKVIAPSTEGGAAALIVLSVYKKDGAECDINLVYDELIAIFHDLKIHFFSIVITVACEATWVGSNIRLPKKEDVVEKTFADAAKDLN